jgi:dsDNA-binding SOS-regulon protein
MAVVTLFMSDRDISKKFTSKKEADEYDKLLELAEAVSHFMEKKIEGLSEQQVEEIGLVFARNKDLLAQAIKGKSDVLFASENKSTEDKSTLDKSTLEKG